MRRRVLQLISSRGFYGAENLLLNLAKSLDNLEWETFLVILTNDLTSQRDWFEMASASGVTVEVIRCRNKVDWHAVRRIQRMVQERAIDVVNTHGYKADLYAWAALRNSRIPLVATCHAWVGRNARLKLYAYLDHILLRRFDAVVGVSENVSAAMYQFGIPRNMIQTIENGVETSRFCHAPRRDFNGAGDKRRMIIGVVGRLVPIKGVEFAIRAFQDVVRRFPDTMLAIVGDGPLSGPLKDIAAELGLNGDVLFLGTRHDMPEMYASMDIFVLPSLYEATSMAILEAMASHKPVIATDVGGTSVIIKNGENGLLVEPKNAEALAAAIIRLLEEPELSRRLAANGCSWVEKRFSAHGMGQQYKQLYEKLLGLSPAESQEQSADQHCLENHECMRQK
jgi:glycosyltransferase involved in cell wall biosynthesis